MCAYISILGISKLSISLWLVESRQAGVKIKPLPKVISRHAVMQKHCNQLMGFVSPIYNNLNIGHYETQIWQQLPYICF